jgi:hypothetical protein
MLPGTAARVPIKQARDCRLQPARQSFPARARRFNPSILEAVFSGERPATLHAAKNSRTTGNGRRDFLGGASRRRRAPREAANCFHSRAHLFQIAEWGRTGARRRGLCSRARKIRTHCVIIK